MLSPEEIQKIRSEAGMPPLTTGTGAAASSLSDRLGLNAPIKEVAPEEPSLGKKLLNRAKYATTESINRISDSYNDPNASALDTAGTAAHELTGGAIMHTIGAAGGAVGDVIGSALDTASNMLPINPEQSDSFKKSANPFNKSKDVVVNPSTEEAPNNNDLLSKAYSKWQEFSANNPNQAKDLEDIGNAFNLLGIESLGKTAVGSALKTSAKDALKKTGADVLVGGITSKVTKPVSNTIKSIKGTGLSKTPEEILATPESQAHKLNTAERDFYKNAQKEKITKQFEEEGNMTKNEFKAKQEALDAAHNMLETKVKTQLTSDIAKSEKEIADLTKEVDQTAYNKTIELKPKAINALREQSKTYSKLIDEDIAPYKDTYIDDKEIIKAIQDKFPSNPYSPDPYKADRLIKEMGLAEGSTRKVGEVYDNLKNIKSMMSAAGKKGSKVLNPSDMDITDKISALSDALSANGVDLSRANQFWKQWAPLRDKIVTKLKPFDTGNFETKTFSDILKNSGNDIHNQNFIKEFEKVLGESITTETQSALSKLSNAQKAKIAAEVDAKIAIEDAKLAKKYKMDALSSQEQAAKTVIRSNKDTAEEALKLKQYNIDRLAARRSAFKTALKGIGVAATGYGVGVPVYNAVMGN